MAVALKMEAGAAVIGLLVVAREAAQVLSSRWVAVRMLGQRLRVQWLDPGIEPLLRAGWMLGAAGVCYKLAIFAGGFILYEIAAPRRWQAISLRNACWRRWRT